jgi:hypothetical protein
MTTFTFQNYNVVVSLGEKSIFLKLIDQVSLINYEANIDAKVLCLQFDLDSIYYLLCQTFNREEGYNVEISIIRNGFIKMDFHLLINGFLKIDFEAVLNENPMKPAAHLFNRMEQALARLEEKVAQQHDLVKQLKEQIETTSALEGKLHTLEEGLAVAEMNILRDSCLPGREPLNVKIGETHLELDYCSHPIQLINVSKLQYLFRLRNLSFTGQLQKQLTIATLEELSILDGNFFLVEELDLSGLPKLQKLTLRKPTGLTNLAALYTYCVANNVELTII